MDHCEWMCYKEPDCVSVNFEIGIQQCDLNNATHRNHGAELEDKDGSLYHGADVRAKLRIIKNISFSVFFFFFFSFCTCPSLSSPPPPPKPPPSPSPPPPPPPPSPSPSPLKTFSPYS